MHFVFQGDLFGGLNSGLQDGLLSRAEALAADLGKHNAGTPMPLKHDPVSVYHHGAHMPTPHPNNRPHHQVQSHLLVSPKFLILFYRIITSHNTMTLQCYKMNTHCSMQWYVNKLLRCRFYESTRLSLKGRSLF